MTAIPHPHGTKPKQRRLSRAASVNSPSNPGSPIIIPSNGINGSAGSSSSSAYPASSSAIAISPTGHSSHESSANYFSISPKPIHSLPSSVHGNHLNTSFKSTGTSSAHYSHEGRAAFSPTYSVNHAAPSTRDAASSSHHSNQKQQHSNSVSERRDGKRPSYGPAFATVGEEKARRSGLTYGEASSEESGGSARDSVENPNGMDAGVRVREKERDRDRSRDKEKERDKHQLGYIPPQGTHGLGFRQDAAGPSVLDEGPKPPGPKIFGIELKWISLLTLALQNALLTIIMHYSRITANPARTYSAASAVLVNELLKGSISLLIALKRTDAEMTRAESHALSPVLHSGGLPKEDVASPVDTKPKKRFPMSGGAGGKLASRVGTRNGSRRAGEVTPASVWIALRDGVIPYTKGDRWSRLFSDILSADCWKLAIPAVLYVIQNNLQYVAASNLDVATFQVTYQMKILTTAFFSVIMLRKRLTTSKWLSLLLLAVGVGIVQIQSNSSSHAAASHAEPSAAAIIAAAHEHVAGSLRSEIPEIATSTDEITDLPLLDEVHAMQPWKGFLAVMMACMTSGLAGVYFEMVLKGSKADLWTRNVQLSMFSLLPALIPVFFTGNSAGPGSGLWGLLSEPFRNFSWWAWGTVFTQVFGGLITALVIKYSDNILKGFATSLSIILSFIASVGLFDYPVTMPFVLGSMVVLTATWMYNQPESSSNTLVPGLTNKVNRQDVATMGSPVSASAPIIGETPKPSRTSSMVSLLGLAGSSNGNSRVGTPGLQALSHILPPTDYLGSQPYRGGSPALNQPAGFHTAPPSPHLNGHTLSSQSSSTNLYEQGLTFSKQHSNGAKRSGGSPSTSGAGTPNGLRHASGPMGGGASARPVLAVDTSDYTSKMR